MAKEVGARPFKGQLTRPGEVSDVGPCPVPSGSGESGLWTVFGRGLLCGLLAAWQLLPDANPMVLRQRSRRWPRCRHQQGETDTGLTPTDTHPASQAGPKDSPSNPWVLGAGFWVLAGNSAERAEPLFRQPGLSRLAAEEDSPHRQPMPQR